MESTTFPQTHPKSLKESVPLVYDGECSGKEKVEPPIPNVVPVTTPTITDVKMQKIFYGAIAAVAIAIGYIALVIGTAPSLLLAIPTLTLGGYLVWKVIRMKDYADPIELQKYRNQAARQPLEATAIEHGWENMFQYGIPTQDDFNKLYDSYMQSRTFREGTLIGAYESLNACRDHCLKMEKLVQIQIPTPNIYSEKFKSEIAGKSLVDIFNEFPIEQLVKYNLLDKDISKVFKAYNEARQFHARESRVAKQENPEDWKQSLDVYERRLREAQPQTEIQKNWVEVELQNIGFLRQTDNTSVTPYTISDDEIGTLKELFEAGVKLKAEIIEAKNARKARLEELDRQLNETIEGLNRTTPFNL